MKKLYWQLPFLALLIIGTFLIIKQQSSMPYQHDSGLVFGTQYHITYQSDKNLKTEIEAELKKVDGSLSMFNDSSTISRINRGERPNLESDAMFVEVFRLAQRISEETDGAFDMTVAPLVNAWGFGFKSGAMPTQQQVDSLRQLVGYQKVKLVDNRGVKEIEKDNPRMMLDASAIAKGYGCDVVARLFRHKDIQNFMIEIGGEIVTSGMSEKKTAWKIGVSKPDDDSLSVSQEFQTILKLTDLSMATSGNYRNFYYKEGKKYAHTIDPKTGKPVQHSLLSATVFAKNCATADAYATSFMVMGLERAKKVLEKHSELMAYLIYSDAKGRNSVWFSPRLEKKIDRP